MRKIDITGLKFVAIGFACLVIATAILRTLNLTDLAPGVAGAILLSVLIASTSVTRRKKTSEA